MQVNVMHMCKIAVSFFWNLWMLLDAATDGRRTMPNQIMKMEKHPLTNKHFDICYIVQSYSILFIFIYGYIMHRATYFQLSWLDYMFPWNCLIWCVLIKVTFI